MTNSKDLMGELVNKIYDISETFPINELFGITSQIRRPSLSIILNYIEGYARQRKAVLKNFLEIAYGSLKETKYLIYFSNKRKYLSAKNHDDLMMLIEEIGRMFWGAISRL